MRKTISSFKNHDVWINLIFIVLAVINIIFFSQIINNAFQSGFAVKWDEINNIFTIIAAIIILGYISTRLPKFRKMENNQLYEIGYLIIMGLLSITVSFFNKETNAESVWLPFIEMFKILSVMLIFTIFVSRLKSFKNMINGNVTWRNRIISLIIFSILGIVASYYTADINGVPANVRPLIVMIAGLFAGPFVGIGSGLISGVWRFYIGGVTAFPCSISTILSGIIGSLIFVLNNHKFLGSLKSAILMFLFTGLDMLLIVLLTPANISFNFVNNIYAPTVFAAVLGILLFTLILGEFGEYDIDTDESDDDLTSRVEKLEESIKDFEDNFNK